LAESVRYNYPIDLKNTWIEQIKRLQAGEYVLVDSNGLELHKYWKRDITPRFKGTVEEAKTEILRLMRESVNISLRSDVPVAVLLSGGIDSSAIAALAKESGREVHVITAGYKGQHDCDEREVAKRFAAEKGLIYHEVELDAGDFQNIFWEYHSILMNRFVIYLPCRNGHYIRKQKQWGSQFCWEVWEVMSCFMAIPMLIKLLNH